MTPQKKARNKTASLQSAFWDTSAIIPLCCLQPQTKKARESYRLFPGMVVWWVTRVECTSALYRLERDRELSTQQMHQSLQVLEKHGQHWIEVSPLDEVRNLAERLLRIYSLRAADALQLPAALVWCNSQPRGSAFISADGGLAEAAEKEGFNVVKV